VTNRLVVSLLVLSAVLAVLFSSGCTLPDGIGDRGATVPTFIVPPTPTPLVQGTVVSARRGAISGTVQARARVVAAEQADLSFPIDGRLKTFKLQIGDQVEKGDLLAELYDYQGEEQLLAAEQRLKVTQLQLQQQTVLAQAGSAEMERARINMEKAAAAVQAAQRRYDDAGGTSTTRPSDPSVWLALQGATLDYTYAKADYEVFQKTRQESQGLSVRLAEQEASYARLMLDRARKRITDTLMLAPFSGIISTVDATVGDQVAAYAPIGALANLSVMAVEASVAEADYPFVLPGQKATVVLDGYPKDVFRAEVKTMAGKPTVLQGRTLYQVTLQFESGANVPATFRMGADVRIVTRVQSNALLVPSQAVYVLDTRSYVDLLDAGKKRRVEVETGLVGMTDVEILSGLKDGDKVVAP
jgi:multidrug efflux pump subunit AcrA (membrane-fusion protein)